MAPRALGIKKRQALELAADLARFVIRLNDTSPLPPDVHHRAMEQAARQLLHLLGTPLIIVPRKRPVTGK